MKIMKLVISSILKVTNIYFWVLVCASKILKMKSNNIPSTTERQKKTTVIVGRGYLDYGWSPVQPSMAWE